MANTSERATLQPNPAEAGVACRLCGGSRFSLRHEWDVDDRWNQTAIPLAVWDCDDCGLVMLHPVPTAEELPDRGDWFSPSRKDMSRQSRFKNARRDFTYRYFGDKPLRLLRACRKLKPGGRLLDVGCGGGYFLGLAAPYYECHGVEPSARAAAAARKRGFTIHEGLAEDVVLEDDFFDMVTLDSVIEHVRDPVAVLAHLRKAIRPGGYVGMITPKIGGPSYRWHKAEWHGFRHGYHTFLFTGKTLKAVLEKAGFVVVRRPQRNRPLDDSLVMFGRKPA